MVSWLSTALITVFSAGLLMSSVAQAMLLSSQPSVSLGFAPVAIAVKDLNWDSANDLIAVDATGNSISIIPNNGALRVENALSYAVGNGPVSVVLAEMTGDGYTDIAVANLFSNDVAVLENKSRSGIVFNPASFYAAGTAPGFITASQLNGDSLNDLIVVNQGSNAITVLLNDGSGAFPVAVSYGVGTSPVSVVAADFDGDTDIDLAVANLASNTVSILFNDGAGGMGGLVSYPAGPLPSAIAVLDMDHNGTNDIVVSNSSSATVSWLSNSGGSFSFVASYSVGNNPQSIVADDIDGDLYDDLLVANKDSHTVSVLINNRDGTFAAAQDISVGTNPISLAVTDIDLDYDFSQDLLVANVGSSDVSIVLNETDFQPDQFSFVDLTGIVANSSVESDAISLSGMGGWSPLSITGGEYSVSSDGIVWSGWSSAASQAVTTGWQVKLRAVSSSSPLDTVNVTLGIGRIVDTFSVTTEGDAAPEPFFFNDQTGVPLDSLVGSNPITVTGIDVDAPIKIEGGVYRVNGGEFLSAPSTVAAGDVVELRVTSSAVSGGTVSAKLTIGGVEDTFDVTSVGLSTQGGGSGGGSTNAVLLLLLLLYFWNWRRLSVGYRAHGG